MKKLIYVILGLVIVSCSNKNSNFLNGDWIYTVRYLNENLTDSLVVDSRVKFLDNGEILIDKYNLWSKYKIEGSKFFFISEDSVSSEYNILEATASKYQIERKESELINGEDSVVFYARMVFVKTDPLPDKPYDKLLTEIAKLYNIGVSDTLSDGTLFFSFKASRFDAKNRKLIYDSPFVADSTIKGAVDKQLGILPSEVVECKYSELLDCIQSSYVWENTELVVKMENNYWGNKQEDQYLDSRIWITAK